MNIYDIYMHCDDVKPGAAFRIYNNSTDYICKTNPIRCAEINELDEDEQLWDVSAYTVADAGFTVHVRLAI